MIRHGFHGLPRIVQDEIQSVLTGEIHVTLPVISVPSRLS